MGAGGGVSRRGQSISRLDGLSGEERCQPEGKTKTKSVSISQNIWTWRFVERDDQAIAQALWVRPWMACIRWMKLDGFFVFLKESDVMAVWQSFQIDAIQRILSPPLLCPRRTVLLALVSRQ